MTGRWGTIRVLACGVLLLALAIVPAAADTMVREENTDHDGNDSDSLFPGSAGYNGTAASCMENCLGRADCNGATFVERDSSCWLKENVPPASEREGMTSFLRQKEGAPGAAAVSSPPAGTTVPAGTPVPAATKKSPGFAWTAATGCLGVLVVLGRKA
jgi:hypothetical protein